MGGGVVRAGGGGGGGYPLCTIFSIGKTEKFKPKK